MRDIPSRAEYSPGSQAQTLNPLTENTNPKYGECDQLTTWLDMILPQQHHHRVLYGAPYICWEVEDRTQSPTCSARPDAIISIT